jgi:uncharacterized protein YecT (DUF1311 family)/uncharacterized caspase-like protein
VRGISHIKHKRHTKGELVIAHLGMNKMTKLLLCILLLSALPFGRAQQTVTQEQCQQADAQLNQVYQQLRGTLNDAQKQQLKQAQRDWIKKRDAFIAQNPGNSQGALYQATMQRVNEFQRIVQQISGSEQVQEGSSSADGSGEEQSSIEKILQSADERMSLSQIGYKQVPTQNEIQLADTQLNKVYQQLSGLLTKEKKRQLKGAQQDWLVERDDNIKRNPLNPQRALYTNTRARTKELEKVIKLKSEASSENRVSSSDQSKIIKELPKDWMYIKGQMLGKIYPSYQKIKWDQQGVISEVVGKKIRCISTDEGPYIHIFDAKTKIYIGSINCDDFPDPGSFSQGEVPWMLMLSGDESFLYFQRWTLRSPGIETFIVDTNTLKAVKISHQAIPFFFSRGEREFQISERPSGPSLEYSDPIKINPKRNTEYDALTDILDNNPNTTGYIISPTNPEIVSRVDRVSDYTINAISINDKIVPGISLTTALDLLKGRYFKERIAALELENKKRGNWQPSWPQGLIYSIECIDRAFSLTYIPPNSGITAFKEIPEKIKVSILNLNHLSISAPTNAKRDVVFEGNINSSNQSFFCFKTNWPNQNIVNINNPNFDFYWPLSPEDKRNQYWGGYCEFYGTNRQLVVYSSGMGCRIGGFPSIGFLNITSRKWLAATEGSNAAIINLGSPSGYGNRYDGYSSAKTEYGPLYSFDPKNNSIWTILNEPNNDSSSLICIDASSGQVRDKILSTPQFEAFAVDGNYILASTDVSELKVGLWDKKSTNKIVDFYFGVSNGLAVVTPDAFFTYNKEGSKLVAFHLGNRAFPLEQFDLRLNRPDIVLERLGAPKEAIETAKSLRDKRMKRMGVTEDMLKPDFHLPELQIVGDVPASTSKDQLDLQIKATDDKYPLDRLRVYVNNVPINGTEGESLRDQKTQSLDKTIPIKLAAGRNKIQVSVLNSAGAESLYANAEVNCTAERAKPKLYAVALGVSQYDRPEWCLKYAAKDATDLINKIKEKAGSSYSEVKPLLLTDKEVTKESAAKIKEFLSGATIDDTVLIFMAGHGILDDKYDYYFGTTDIDPAKPSERGMPYEAIDTILAEVPSLKKALLMDTCHAGELDDDEKKELASSDGKGTLPAASSTATDSAIKGTVAMRAIGTRGMTVKAVEGAKGKSDWYEKLQDMFVDLRRGSGATVISSSQGAEYAFESSEQSNGIFTYALMEALDGKATPNKDGQITISAIGDYVKKRVQDLTKGKQNPNLRGVNLEEDFTLSSTK